MLTARLATAVVLLAVFVAGLLVLPNSGWMALLVPVLLVAGWEWAALASLQGAGRWLFTGFTVMSAAALWAVITRPVADAGRPLLAEALIYGAACAFWLFIAIPWLRLRRPLRSPIALAAAGWIALVPAWLAMVRLQMDPAKLLALLGIIWIADTAAYFAGTAWGRHKLAPGISPGKTWEGVAGAAGAVAVYYVVLTGVVPGWSGWQGVGGASLFAGVAAMGIVGDLFESWLKRQAGVKDSGTLLPGHGGVLDRIDSLTASMPLAALLLPLAG